MLTIIDYNAASYPGRADDSHATPRLLIVHADVNRVPTYAKDGSFVPLAEYLASLVRQLQGGGAQIAAVSAVTPAHLHL